MAVAVGLAVAELRPVLPDDGEGVRDAPPEAVLVVTPGVGVKTDGTVEEGDPPPLQAATATASTARAGRGAAGLEQGRPGLRSDGSERGNSRRARSGAPS